ncbi:MAG TPA: sulfatase-like hydrolase/transferase [Verrucomicrobiales bacterium]|nr:sulfatase-like hydrolase/transferase [Verrucomicrobiales bacterium]
MYQFLCFLLVTAQVSFAAGRNILLIIADDYGQDSSALYNTSAAASLPPTPNIASLRSGGVLFRNAWAHPTCSPTRASLLTGRHPFRTGVDQALTGTSGSPLPAAELTLPEIFAARAVEYATAQFGKWHLTTGPNTPNTIGGWPHFAGSIQGAVQDYSSWNKVTNGVTTVNYTTYATTDVVNDAVTWIQARGTQPWFAWVAFNAGHTPLHKPPNDLHSKDSLSGTQANINANPRPYFEAMIEAMDTEIGRLLLAVDRSNTHIIFLGDNGTTANVIQPPWNAHAKGSLYEGGVRVPMVINSPDIVSPGRESQAIVHAVDVFSTILELAGIDQSAAVPGNVAIDSRSLIPILKNQAETSERYAYSEIATDENPSNRPGATVRNSTHKLIRFTDGNEELYDLRADPYETTDLMAGTLSSAAQANYYALVLKLAESQDTMPAPEITATALGAGGFSVTVKLSSGTTYELWRSADLGSLSWAPVSGAAVVIGNGAVTLTDSEPAGARVYYRVLATVP